MKINSKVKQALRLFVLAALISACTLPASTSDEVEVHFGRPSAGDVIMLGESFDLLANGSSTGEEVSRALFFADGVMVGEDTNGAGSSVDCSSYTSSSACAAAGCSYDFATKTCK